MKVLEQYQCDICKTVFKDVESCKKCERSHYDRPVIVKQSFTEMSPFPKTIYIIFSDVEGETHMASYEFYGDDSVP